MPPLKHTVQHKYIGYNIVHTFYVTLNIIPTLLIENIDRTVK